MRFNSKKSNNYSILKNLFSKTRNVKLPHSINYIILYTFLYKYCSDNVKDHLLLELSNEEMTLDEAFRSVKFSEVVNHNLLKLFGFYFKKSDSFIDEVISTSFSDSSFLSNFLTIFPQNIVFSDEFHDVKYFEELFKTIQQEVQSDNFEYDEEVNSAVKEIIYYISKLNIFESKFSFSNAFDALSSSKLMTIDSNPGYITQILSSIVSSQKSKIGNAYDPFIKDGSSMLNLYNEIGYGLRNCYGKEVDKLTYSYSIVRFFINAFSFNNIFLKHEDAIESIDINAASFDAILSKIPIAIKNYHSNNINQNLEIAKRNKRSEVEDVFIKKFGIDSDSFTRDADLNNALENLIEKMDFEASNGDFVGEYESLQDSEFLFLINLIDSLKDDGIMAISISENFLSKNSLYTLRKYLTYEKNYIDTIISIPDEIERYAPPEVVIVFKKNRNKKDILFIDMSKDYKTQRSNIIFPGQFGRNLILDGLTINKMIDAFSNKLTIKKYSQLITIDEIQKNYFNLGVSRYVDTFEGEFINLIDLVEEKEGIDSNIKRLNLKIEKMMDEFNIGL